MEVPPRVARSIMGVDMPSARPQARVGCIAGFATARQSLCEFNPDRSGSVTALKMAGKRSPRAANSYMLSCTE